MARDQRVFPVERKKAMAGKCPKLWACRIPATEPGTDPLGYILWQLRKPRIDDGPILESVSSHCRAPNEPSAYFLSLLLALPMHILWDKSAECFGGCRVHLSGGLQL